MARNGWLARRWSVILGASLGGVALASCTSGPGGIVVENDGSGGAKGDGSSDAREAGGSGGAAGTAVADSSVDTVADMAIDRSSGDGGLPPLCVYHTDPPPGLIQDDSGIDESAADVIGSDAGEAGTPDATADASGADVNADASAADATVSDAVASDASTVDVVADTGGDVVGDRSGGGRDGGGDAGDAGPAPSITILTSPFLGPYLADSAGRTLYTFGNERPGDCTNLPITDCEADCAIAWPPFDAGKRTLAMGLDPAVFGSVARADGVSQITTYYGWPLYYYKSDPTGGVINGQGKSKTWHVATVTPANMVIMRDKTNPRYVASGTGQTLYVFDQDTVGTAGSDPVSSCSGSCLMQYPPFQLNRFNAVSSLDPSDLSLFVRSDTGRQQVAYKGAPLYLYAADMRSGDQNGVSTGWTVAAAP